MPTKYDPSLSSRDYLELARQHADRGPTDHTLKWMIEDVEFGLQQSSLDSLLDSTYWHPDIKPSGRRPRVFVASRVNQRGNLELRWAGHILYGQDYMPGFINAALRSSGLGGRSCGELMWFRDFRYLRSRVINHRDPVAKAILFGLKARIDELFQQLERELDFIGGERLQFTYDGEDVTEIDFDSGIPENRLGELAQESQYQHLLHMKRIYPRAFAFWQTPDAD